MIFWVIAFALAACVVALLGLAMLRSRGDAVSAAEYDIRIYRDQLRDVDRDLARGVIADGDADRVRAEISRRILAADDRRKKAGQKSGSQGRPSFGVVLVIGFVLIGGALLLYRDLGAPGYGDLGLDQRKELAEQARRSRPDQTAAEATLPPQPPVEGLSEDYLKLVERLRETVAERPGDAQGLALLARNEAAVGNFQAAYKAQEDLIRAKGDGASAQDYADYADMLILAAGGYVSPQAERALAAALERDSGNEPALYYWGLMMSQTGRPDVAYKIWSRLLRQSPPDAPWSEPIKAQIEEVAFLAGIEYTPPPTTLPPRGPSAEDVEAASDMSEEDRMDMVRGMVQQLNDRLASEGGAPSEWARLIGALGVLGETDRARAIYDEALGVFAGNDAALEPIRAAARRAGIAE